MQLIKEPKEFDYLKAWLLFFFTSTALGFALGFIIGSVIAAFMGARGASLPEMAKVNRIVGFVIGIPVSYVTFRAIVGKYLFPRIEEDSAPPKSPPL